MDLHLPNYYENPANKQDIVAQGSFLMAEGSWLMADKSTNRKANRGVFKKTTCYLAVNSNILMDDFHKRKTQT